MGTAPMSAPPSASAPAAPPPSLAPARSRRGLHLSAWRYLNVIGYQAYAGLRAEVARTYLGLVWWLLEPVFAAAAMYLIFGVLLGRASTPNYFAFLVVGTFAWQWFAGSVGLAANSILQKSGLIQQVYLPKFVFPTVAVLSATWKFLCAFLVMMVYLTLSGHPPTAAWAALPALWVAQFLLNLAVAWPLAVWVPYFRDGTTVITSVLQVLGFASGIFFSPAQVPESLRGWFDWNPMAALLVAYRGVLMDGAWPDFARLALIAAGALALLAFGAWLLRRVDLSLPKVVQ